MHFLFYYGLYDIRFIYGVQEQVLDTPNNGIYVFHLMTNQSASSKQNTVTCRTGRSHGWRLHLVTHLPVYIFGLASGDPVRVEKV